MNRIMYGASLAGIALSLALLVVTAFADHLIRAFARDYVNRRVEPAVTHGVALLEHEVLPRLRHVPVAHAAHSWGCP